ncbi:zinc-ribbon domain containing protein [Niveibacterium sp. 24ML]|uniref:zinc-ribbon domain containing protein n=1 Tax=Niveibacterium sp. 24ML TaxID=2985512 RepID=UPI003B636914
MKSGKQRRAEIKHARLQRRSRREQALARVLARTARPGHGAARCDAARLAPANSCGLPEFVRRGYYEDQPFRCKDCGAACVWTAASQKWWYEVMQGGIETRAVRCTACRARERARKAQARRVQQEGSRARAIRPAENKNRGNSNALPDATN